MYAGPALGQGKLGSCPGSSTTRGPFIFWYSRVGWASIAPHILCYHLGISNHRILCWIWCIWRKITQMHLCISSFSWKYETGTVITLLFIQMVHGIEILWLVLHFSIKLRNFHDIGNCLIQNPYLPMKSGQS